MIDQHTGIWLDNKQTHWFDVHLSDSLCKFFKSRGNSVVDFGCGKGEYLACFRDNGIVCKGYDGNPVTPEISKGFGEVLDLSAPINLPIFDRVLSLEVGEHIPKNKEKIFIKNICSHCKQGAIISWAIPGQGGEGHVNECSNEYVKVLFKEFGMILHNNLTQYFRKKVELKWFINTLMVFVFEKNS